MSNLSYNSIEQKENDSNGKFLYISESSYDTDWRSYPHQHFCAEIFFVRSGSGEFQVEENKFKVKKDTIVIINSNLQHTEYSTSNDPMSYYVIGIEDLDFTFTKSQKKYGIINDKKLSRDAHDIMGRMIEENKNQKPHYSVVCKKLAEIFMISLQRQEDIKVLFTDVYNISKECLIAKDYIDNNYSLNIDLDILAEKAHLSRFYLSRKFSEEFGVSPMQYLTEKRLQVANQLLSYTNFTIAQIAESIGYSSQSYFAQVYKKNKWVSPVEYRKKQIGEHKEKKIEY